MLDLIIKNGLCYIDGKLKKADIGINNSKISEIGSLENKKSTEVFDASNTSVDFLFSKDPISEILLLFIPISAFFNLPSM